MKVMKMFSIKKCILLIPLIAILLFSCAEDCKFESIKTELLNDAQLNTEYYYKIELETSCAVVFREIEITDGKLPKGMNIDPSGEVTGTPEETGTFSFTIKVRACFGSNGFEYTGCADKTKTLSLEVIE